MAAKLQVRWGDAGACAVGGDTASARGGSIGSMVVVVVAVATEVRSCRDSTRLPAFAFTPGSRATAQ